MKRAAVGGWEQEQEPVPRTMLTAIGAGTVLNPLNSSMIAVALTTLSADFGTSLTTTTWLISGFYLAAAVGQPLMGRLGDLFGARRIFAAGLVIVCIVGLLAPLSPSIWWLVAARVVMAFGTSAAYPSGLAMIRTHVEDRSGAKQGETRPPATALGTLSIAANVSAALGPTLGGPLVVVAGWPAIFLVNVPLTLFGLAATFKWLPPGQGWHCRSA